MTNKFKSVDWEERVVVLVGEDEGVAFANKSAMFVHLYENGMSIADIAKSAGAHYSFVHGVIKRKCEISNNHRETKTDKIIEFFNTGMTVKEISVELDAHYSFVHGVVKRYKANNSEEVAVKEEAAPVVEETVVEEEVKEEAPTWTPDLRNKANSDVFKIILEDGVNITIEDENGNTKTLKASTIKRNYEAI